VSLARNEGTAEGIVVKHFPAYDPLSMNSIPKNVGCRIAAEWREVALALRTCQSLKPGLH